MCGCNKRWNEKCQTINYVSSYYMRIYEPSTPFMGRREWVGIWKLIRIALRYRMRSSMLFCFVCRMAITLSLSRKIIQSKWEPITRNPLKMEIAMPRTFLNDFHTSTRPERSTSAHTPSNHNRTQQKIPPSNYMLAENDRISIPSAGSSFHLLSINMQPMEYRMKTDQRR